MRTTTFTFLDYLPNSLREAPKRRAAEFVGLGVLAALVAACVALVTWSVADPSLNHATSTPIHNLLGTSRRGRSPTSPCSSSASPASWR